MEFEREFFYDEVQDGFYVPGIMKRAWAGKMELLSEIDKICKKWDISYYASYGTLLGAVRHKGFIPWDDDIDIMMQRPDFERFSQVIKDELKEGMYYISMETVKDRLNFTTAVCVESPLLFPENLRKYHEFPYSNSVDIFFLDELAKDPEDEEFRKNIINIFSILIYDLKQKREKTELFQSNLTKLEELLEIHFDRNSSIEGQMYEILNQIFREFEGEGGEELVCYPDYYAGITKPFPKAALGKAKWLPFHNMTIPVPEDYDTVLRAFYGDYSKREKKGDSHSYSSFKEKDKEFNAIFKDKWNFNYTFSENVLVKTELKSFRDSALEVAESLITLGKNILHNFLDGKFSLCLLNLSKQQEEVIAFGNLIEKRKGEGTESVSLLEEYCEALYQVYVALENVSINEKDTLLSTFLERPQEYIDLEKKLKNLCVQLESIRSMLERELKKQIVFLPHRAKHFASLCPLIDALNESGDFDCKIIPIPYYDRLGDGSLSDMHYEGEEFPKEYEITDYRSFNFAEELPDAIVINSPYDEFNQVFTVDPFFYSKEMRKFTKKLVYIPWFVTDEIDTSDENDGKAFYNMNYYVTVPGVFYADLTIVQSEQMKKAYLEKISEFTNKEISKKMEKKISGAGSCLFGKKKGQGTREVVKCFREFLFESCKK